MKSTKTFLIFLISNLSILVIVNGKLKKPGTKHVTFNDQSLEALEDTDSDVNDSKENCWITLNAKKHCEDMEEIEKKYNDTLRKFNANIKKRNLDETMRTDMIEMRAMAERAIYHATVSTAIPSGIDLGGNGMLKMPNSVLFFHRIKLRNNTVFDVNHLENDMNNMILIGRLTLNDLILFGSYLRAITNNDDLTELSYRPTFGEIQFILKDCLYKMEGRYRYIDGKLVIEHIVSDLRMEDIYMTFENVTNEKCPTTPTEKPEQIPIPAMADFIDRLKVDLDNWVKDYFNDYLSQKDLKDQASDDVVKYDKDKLLVLNEYVDNSLLALKQRLYTFKPRAADVRVPDFKLSSATGVEINLHDGILRNLDSFYRTSVSTGRKDNAIRMVDADIAFRNLKLEYRYEAKIDTDVPILHGYFALTADDLIAHLGMALVKEPETVDLAVSTVWRPHTTQSLIVEGTINRQISNFKYILEDEIISLMSNTLLYHVKLLSTLTRCEPILHGVEDDGSADDEIKKPLARFSPMKVSTNDSFEIEIPAEGDRPLKTLHINYKEKLVFDEVKARRAAKDDGDDEETRRRNKHHKKHKHGRKH